MDQEAYKKIAQDISEMPIPKYYRLKMDIIGKINTGVWPDHAKLPSENELCKQYGVSRITVRKTLDELVSSKFIYKIQGKGSYVAPQQQREVVITKNTYGCGEMLSAQGRKPSHKVEFQGLVPCPEPAARCLNLETGDLVMYYVRTYYGDGRPVIYARSYINYRKLPGIELIDLRNYSLSELISDKYGLTVTNKRCTLQAISAGQEIGKALAVDPEFPLLSRNTIANATDGTESFPLEVNQLYYRTDTVPYISKS